MAHDIAFSFNRDTKEFDLAVTDTDLLISDSLLNEILISLFTWRADTEEPTPDMSRMGYWGDGTPCAPDSNPEPLGSLLWKLEGKLTEANINNALVYTQEALRWMTDDTRIASYEVTANRSTNNELDILICINVTGDGKREYYLSELQQMTARGF